MSTLLHPAESERLALPAADGAKSLGISERQEARKANSYRYLAAL